VDEGKEITNYELRITENQGFLREFRIKNGEFGIESF
jgi:capsule polysaccharide export protein KpsE/RkpR